MTMASRFTQPEHGGFPVEPAALGRCDLAVAYVGGGWPGALAGMWRKDRRGPVLLPATRRKRSPRVSYM
jgi:hypothetical protein